MLSREDVVWGFRYLLGREPESEAVIEQHMQMESREGLRRALLASPEFLAGAEGPRFPDTWVIAPVLADRRRLWLNLADRHVSLGCLRDDYEPFETGVISRLLEPGMTFLDIGANIGWFTLLASTAVGSTGRIHAFEPRPETHTFLKKSVAINRLQSMVKVHRVGVAEAAGRATLAWTRHTDNPGGSHLAAGVGSNDEGASIRLIAVDSLELTAVDVVKIDVEGAEYRAMRGAENLLRRQRPVILSELHPAQLASVSGCSAADYLGYMASLDYDCLLAHPLRPGERLTDFPAHLGHEVTNVVFAPAERSARVGELAFG